MYHSLDSINIWRIAQKYLLIISICVALRYDYIPKLYILLHFFLFPIFLVEISSINNSRKQMYSFTHFNNMYSKPVSVHLYFPPLFWGKPLSKYSVPSHYILWFLVLAQYHWIVPFSGLLFSFHFGLYLCMKWVVFIYSAAITGLTKTFFQVWLYSNEI